MTVGQSCQWRTMCSWLGWFFFINSLLAWLIIFGYLPQMGTLTLVPDITSVGSVFAYLYFIFAFLAQVSVFMFICGLLCLLVYLMARKRWLCMLVATFLSAILLCCLITDAIVFRLFHMHYAVIGFQVIQAGAISEVLPLGVREKLIAVCVVLAALLLEALLAWLIWRLLVKRSQKLITVLMSCLLGIWVLVYSSFSLAAADIVWHKAYRYMVLRTGRIVPYLSQLYFSVFEHKHKTKILELGEIKTPVLISPIKKKLNYPLVDLKFVPATTKLNVLIIAIDTWRYSSMSEIITPSIYEFSKHSLVFTNHYSGGNCTGPGIFSLFYALPPNYWASFLRARKSPVLIDSLQHQGYTVRAFLSAQSNFPQLDKTIFVNLKTLRRHTHGDTSLMRDKTITNEFIDFVENREKTKPFFAFMFYDALHNYCESDRPSSNPFQPAVQACDRFSLDSSSDALPYLNLYNNKAHYVDQQVARVLSALKAQHLLHNTIVMITADHGEQMNDVGMGLWGHASSYSNYQLHVPLIVYWPGKEAQEIRRQTTHYDIAPTLMNEVLGSRNDPSDYSVGLSLFSPNVAKYFIAGSYGDYAIIGKDKALRVYPSGDYQVVNLDGRLERSTDFNPEVLQKALQDLQRFFHP